MENRLDLHVKKIKETKNNIKNIYKNSNYTWMIGFSGGKDSSVLVQIILESLLEIDKKFYNKDLHIVSSDTLIENPIVLKQLNESLDIIKSFCKLNNLPVIVHKVLPDYNESFWVNLIGRGYPLPNQSFRWCTDRLKIKPMNEYINKLDQNNKDVLTVLGVRTGESNSRDLKLINTKIENSLLRKNNTNNSYVFAPIENFSLFDIWKYLGESNLKYFKKNNNKLSILYEDSSVGVEECPSSLDDKLQKGCGNSRWGCWLCPVVTQDKSLQGFINSGNDWLQPLMDFRNDLIKERDLLENRYFASFRINKKTKVASLIKYRFMDLKEKDGVYFLPKKEGRNKIIYGEYDNKNDQLSWEGKFIKVLTEDKYKELVNNNVINPYNENDITLPENIVIKLNKNKNNNKLTTVGLGPYTLSYRTKLLSKIQELNDNMKNFGVEVISDEEIGLINELFDIVKNALKKDKNSIEKIYNKVNLTMESERNAWKQK
ncbi:DNA sulfur modification protein DndC [Spiroplasma corruscae]|uniref:DNA sulfur modification protein DndC n=1 Tax=Spiroplasma corruscae TaxID=216934 RepID=A0A222EPE8_9MOLU|nr:DNA phosphorothioation system sulfurtransferase DndC [Spiroplasma corruscae]ASP28370.1 DNA sulfur modification protein DndC [Spiroplasma corruscae]